MSKPSGQLKYWPGVSSRRNIRIFYKLEIISEDRRPAGTLEMYRHKVTAEDSLQSIRLDERPPLTLSGF